MQDLEFGFTFLGDFSECQQSHSTSSSFFELKQIIWFTKNDIIFRSGHQNKNSVIHAVPVILKKNVTLSHHNGIEQ